MNKRFKISSKWIFVSLLVLIIINIVLIAMTLLSRKIRKGSEELPLKSGNSRQMEIESDFFDSPCPEIGMFDIKGQKIELREYVGDVIILRFTRFHPIDLPNILFLEHIDRKYRNNGIHLFFINLIGGKYSPMMDESFNFSNPIIDDDGYVSEMFNARLNDTILIGRDFKIKLKANNLENRTIHNQVKRYLFKKSAPPNSPSEKELASMLSRINYINIENGETKNLGEDGKDKTLFINLFVSRCLSCPASRRIRLMEDFSSQIRKEKVRNILLFSKSNNISHSAHLGRSIYYFSPPALH